MNFTILTFDSIDSTNTEALRQARLGAAEGLCIVARQQTAGRGRHGRTWVSEKDAGLFFSIVLKPKMEPRSLPLLTLMSGVAVHATLADLGLEPDIKWVNDVLVNERKIAGVLAETTETQDGVAVIVGIGINIRSASFPPEIADTATSIEHWRAETPPVAELIESLTNHLGRLYVLLNATAGGARAILDEWQSRSTYFSGKRVRVETGRETVIGVTDGLEDNGALRVRKDDGTTGIIQAGDVERVRADGD
jgi:BirA family biotin operon repressor/biotin-[acetyl-CoA-carboxylase] ligase